MTDPTFPPLLKGSRVDGALDPFTKACAQAALGGDPGQVFYKITADYLRAAITFAPEVPLEEAMAMLPACGVGFQNALGALAPPEVAVHLDWSGGITVNGAHCGRLRAAAATRDPHEEPEWLVIGLEVPLIPQSDDPGLTPDQTSLFDEGCVEVDPVRLIESWSRHTLVWINRWSDDGVQPLHAEWRGLARNLGEDIEIMGKSGTFLGVDDRFGMLLRQGDTTDLIPLSTLLKDA